MIFNYILMLTMIFTMVRAFMMSIDRVYIIFWVSVFGLFFIAWYSGNPFEQYAFINRALGPYWWGYWAMIFCNVVVPQFYWFKTFRRHVPFLFITSILVNIGMWFERFVIVVITLHRDFLPGAWSMYHPTIWDVAVYLGTFGIFFTGFLLFLRF